MSSIGGPGCCMPLLYDCPLTRSFHELGQLLVSWSRPVRSSSGCRSLSMVSGSFWHATGTVCSPPSGVASPSVHKYKAQHDDKNEAEHKHQAANAEAMTRRRDERDTGHHYRSYGVLRAAGYSVSRYVLSTRRSTHWSPYPLGPWPMRLADCKGLLALVPIAVAMEVYSEASSDATRRALKRLWQAPRLRAVAVLCCCTRSKTAGPMFGTGLCPGWS